MKHIFITLIIALLTGIHTLSIYAGTLSVSGTITKKITTTENTAAITVRDCDNNVISTIPSEAVTTTKYVPYTKSGQTVRFIVTRLENPAVAVATINTNINTDINYDTIGNFSVDLTDPNIIESRYNYKVQAKISEDSYGSVIFEREYALAPAGSGSAFPIGSIIAYMGNNSNIAGMAANGWFKCNGARIDTISALSADERTALTNILGGSTHLPDLRGNFLRGLDEGRGYDDDAGSRTGGESTTGVRSQQGESMRSHRHQASGSTNTDGDHGHNWRFGTSPDDDGSGSHDREYTKISGGFNALTSDNPIDSAGSAHSHSFSFTTGDPTTSSSGVVPVNGNENRPDNIAVYWLIRGR